MGGTPSSGSVGIYTGKCMNCWYTESRILLKKAAVHCRQCRGPGIPSTGALPGKCCPIIFMNKSCHLHCFCAVYLQVTFLWRKEQNWNKGKSSIFSTFQNGRAISQQKEHDDLRKEKLFHLQLFFLRNT